jgi:hypothetical protein
MTQSAGTFIKAWRHALAQSLKRDSIPMAARHWAGLDAPEHEALA